MSVETQQTTTEIENAAPVSDDAALGAIWDQVERDNGSTRDDAGRFASTKPSEATTENEIPEANAEGKGEGQEGAAEVSTLPAQSVPLPPNWNGMDEDWAKVPAEVQAKIAARDQELHARMSEQGRQISAHKPFIDIIERNRDLFEGKTMPDGRPVNAPFAVDFLMGVQRQLDANPIATILQIADRYGARQMLAAVLSGQAQVPPDSKPQPAGVSPADIERIVTEAFSKNAQVASAEEELGRLSKDKPLYSEIAADDMVHFIHKARAKLGSTASKQAVFDQAYDMAVNADPDLRAKAAAAPKPAAVVPDPKKTEAARRAASVNVTSTTSGKGRQLTEDELLAEAYDTAKAKD